MIIKFFAVEKIVHEQFIGINDIEFKYRTFQSIFHCLLKDSHND